MKRIKNLFFNIILVYSLCVFNIACSSSPEDKEPEVVIEEEQEEEVIEETGPSVTDLTISVPCEGNSWVVNSANPDLNSNLVTTGGIKNWSNANDKIRTYFYAKNTGEILVGIQAKFSSDTTLKVSLGEASFNVDFEASGSIKKYLVGTFTVATVGYHYVELEGVTKAGDSFGDITNIMLGDSTWSANIDYITTDWFYWGRRGPSVHIRYNNPVGKDVKWFYNEVTVPSGNDIIGSYFMANGFSYGYFGMQVNSESERRILFSVWSAFDTQDPNQIPDEYTVDLLGNGSGVNVGLFGNEGSGAQTYYVFDWKPDVTYKFLLKGESIVEGAIDYTAYFFAPEVGEWKLIASLRRPKSEKVHVDDMYSFLENFNTNYGNIEREVLFGNQWAYDTEGNWNELVNGSYTADATARAGARLDYDGGARGNSFYLRNCGFFSDNTNYDINISRTPNGVSPNIDFTTLEVPVLPEPAAELTFLDRNAWSVMAYSSQEDNGGEGETGRASDILDDNLETFWHSCWSGCTATPPHYLTIDMGASKEVAGLQFTQRQSLSRAIKGIEIQISTNGSSWESLGNFELQNTADSQEVTFSSLKTFRYFKVVVNTAHDGTNNAALADVKAFID